MTTSRNAEERAWERRTAARYEDLELHVPEEAHIAMVHDKHEWVGLPLRVGLDGEVRPGATFCRICGADRRELRVKPGVPPIVLNYVIGAVIVVLAGVALWLAAGGWK